MPIVFDQDRWVAECPRCGRLQKLTDGLCPDCQEFKKEVYSEGYPCLGCHRTHMWLVDGLCADCRPRSVENSANLYLPAGQLKIYCAACGEHLMSMQQEHHCKPEVKSDAQRIEELTRRVEALESAIQELRDNGRIQDGEDR